MTLFSYIVTNQIRNLTVFFSALSLLVFYTLGKYIGDICFQRWGFISISALTLRNFIAHIGDEADEKVLWETGSDFNRVKIKFVKYS